MKKKLIEFRQDLASKTKAARKLIKVAKREERDLSKKEQKEFDNLEKDIETLKRKIELEDKNQQLKRDAAKLKIQKRNKKSPEEKAKEKYSFLKAVRSQLPNQKLEGIEKEMHEEAVNEARQSGISIQGVGVPSFFMEARTESRDMVAGTATDGGNLIQTSVGNMIPALRPQLQVEALGANVLTGLVGNLELPKHTGVTTAVWEGENDSNAESTPTVGKISLSPKRVGAFTEVSKQLLAQAQNESVEALVRGDLNTAIRIAVDYAAINGSGASNQPTGVLNTTGIGDVAGGTNGLAPTFDHIVDLETEVSVDNADMGALSYFLTPGIRGTLKKTKVDSGSGQFVWSNGASTLNGYNAVVSTQVPSTLTKGTNSDCHAILFGNWNDLIIANWAGVDLIVDPYTLATEAKIKLVINSWWDIAVRHAESFAAMKDARTS